MPTPSLWSNVEVTVQSAITTANALSAITATSTSTATYGGTDDWATGDYAYLSSIVGMPALDERVIRVSAVNTVGNTFVLEGEDATGYGTFVSGNAQKPTFGTTLALVTDLSTSGGDFDQIDYTTIHDAIKKTIPGAANAIQYSGSCLWDPADAGFIALKNASILKAKRAIKFKFSNGRIAVFVGTIGFTGVPTGSAQDKVVTPFTISMAGVPTYYTA